MYIPPAKVFQKKTIIVKDCVAIVCLIADMIFILAKNRNIINLRKVVFCMIRSVIDLHICHFGKCKKPDIFEPQDRVLHDLGNGQTTHHLAQQLRKKKFVLGQRRG